MPVIDPPEVLLADSWAPDQYALLDSGAGRKLERFGEVVTDRPDPQAFWAPATPPERWDWRARFDAKGGEEERGRWERRGPPIPESWPVQWNGLTALARLTPFRHLGLFQEHAVHWEAAQAALSGWTGAALPRALNLFGYTGMASLACAAAGADVVHLDASPKSNGYGKENQALSGLEDRTIRWIADDATKFAARELRRGNQYEVILADPPKFGRGPKNETWRFEEDIGGLLDALAGLLSERAQLLVVSAYALRLSSWSLAQAMSGRLEGRGGRISHGEMALPESGKAGGTRRVLPTSIYAAWRP